jgi:hypothetical protein
MATGTRGWKNIYRKVLLKKGLRGVSFLKISTGIRFHQSEVPN